MITAISLDLWDTLIESEQGPLESYTLMELEALRKIIGESKNIEKDEIIESYLKLHKYRSVIKPETFAKLLCYLLGINQHDQLLNKAIEAYVEAGYNYFPKLIAGAVELLEYSKKRGLKVVVVTNTHFTGRTVHKMLENIGIAKYVDFVISSADYEVLKPNPRLFKIALDLLKANPWEVIHIGDSCTRDVLGAFSAGMKSILYARREKSIEACKHVPLLGVIKDLREAIPILKKYTGDGFE
ncbi:MAG: HAD family hydrolase [Desulfurococcaceae archaeon]